MDTYFDAIKLPFLIVGFVANFLTIIAHITDPLRVFQNTSSMFVLNVTVIDCTISLLWLISTTFTVAEFKAFFVSYSVIYFNAIVRIATMTAIAYFSLALELYFSISRPLWHRTKVTHKVCRYWIIATWIFHLTFTELTIRFLLSDYENLFTVSYLCSLFVGFEFLNTATFISVRRQGKALRERRDVSEATLRALKSRQENEKRFFVTIAILCFILMLSFCPYLVIATLFSFRSSLPEISDNVWMWLDWSRPCLIMINAMVNPFFYLWRLPKYKKTFKKLYCKCLK
jgi:hypothetical protein